MKIYIIRINRYKYSFYIVFIIINMSQASLSSAKNRRANPQSTVPKPNQPQNIPPYANQVQSPVAANGSVPPTMTLPQVISYVDKRLCILESFMVDTKSKHASGGNVGSSSLPSPDMPTNLSETIEEFDKRYQLLAEEIENLKNIVLNLQSYTMDVNKMLLEDRARIYEQIQEEQNAADASAIPTSVDESNT